jgi:hypothetical protein
LGSWYMNVISVSGGMSQAARTIIMSPMKLRLALLKQLWLTRDAVTHRPEELC